MSDDLHQRALDRLVAGDAGEALALFEQAAARGDTGLDGTMAVALQQLGRTDDAVAAYGRAIVHHRGQLAGLHYNLGTAFAAAGLLDEAAASYEDALAVQPELQVALGNLGVVRQSQGRCEDAERCFRAVLSRAPADDGARYNLGAVLCARGMFTAAEEAFRIAIETAVPPASARAWAGLGASLAAQNDHAAALAACEHAVEIDPALGEAHRHLAASRFAIEDLDGALASAERACELAPDDGEAHEVRGAILASLARLDQAADAFRTAAARAPDRPRPWCNLGAVCERQADREGALAAYLEALARDDESQTALVGAAGALIYLERVDEAISAYQRLLELEPGHPGALHMVAALSGSNPATPPPGYVKQIFDTYAPAFDKNLLDDLGYRAPALLREAIEPHGPFATALDLGCGTGLVGVAIRDRVDAIDGVDLSPKMLDEARAKEVYQQLTCAELVEHLAAATEPSYPLVTAGDVLCYLGDLAPVVAAASTRMAPGGLFVFSVEALGEALDGAVAEPDGDDDYRLARHGRYAHRRSYLERLAAASGLQVVRCEVAELRREHMQPVVGLVCTLQRATS